MSVMRMTMEAAPIQQSGVALQQSGIALGVSTVGTRYALNHTIAEKSAAS